MALDTLDNLLLEQLQDIYYAEKQLVKALPKMAKAASAAELKTAFTNHLAETEEHVVRLEQVFAALGVTAKTKKCPAIEGLIQEAAEMMGEDGADAVLDAGLIASAQRVEHYEMAAYGNVRVFAEALGHDDVVALLDATLVEEHAADELLSEIATGHVIPAALAVGMAHADDGDTDDSDESVSARAAKRSAKGNSPRRK